ncbi:zinc knuckle CX2CX4HX4C containing protein [Tanacetum coccineum]
MLLEHQDIIAEIYGPSRWKELSKETYSKILTCGDGFCWKAFKPIASLIVLGRKKGSEYDFSELAHLVLVAFAMGSWLLELGFKAKYVVWCDHVIFEFGDKSEYLAIKNFRRGWLEKSKADALMARMQQSQAETTKGNACKSLRMTGSPKMIFSPLVSHTTTINMPPRGPFDIDVAATFPLTTVGDMQMLINDIKAGKHNELLAGMTNDDHVETLDALGTICNSIRAGNPIVQFVDINTKSTSYAGAAGASDKDQPRVCSNFRSLVANLVFNGVNIFIPRKVVEKAGLEAVLESGPWMIRQTPIILKKWSMSTSLQKEELTRIPTWVKLHDVLLQVFEEDGISLIGTFIGKPIMLDSYTSSMCKDLWGRSSFARCLIEVNLEADLVDVITIGIPSLTGDDFTKETICVEYEWRPPRCDECKIFDHVHDHCLKKVVSPGIVTTLNVAASTVEKFNDGFQTVGKNKKRKGKSNSTNGGQFVGPSVKQTLRYDPKANTSAPKKGATNVSNPSKLSYMLRTADTSSKKDNFTTSNYFSALNDEEVENVYDESANLYPHAKTGESSSFTAAAG